jgi:hypothetical protein
MEKETMRTTNLILEKSASLSSIWIFALAVSALLTLGYAPLSFGQKSERKTFSSPAEASSALFQAVRNEDEQALETILGGKEVTSSSDEIEDKLERERFGQKYQEMHRLVREPDGSTVLYIGAENWPFPVPLVSKNGAWYFDSESGKQEIRFRRIGENEDTAIEVCEEFAIAENAAGAKAASEDPITRFSESLSSASGANAGSKESSSFHGYYFQVVGVSGPGKARKGLRLIAYPAEYQFSGVKTFVVTQRGIVLEKDLGPETPIIAPQMKARTGSGWHTAG